MCHTSSGMQAQALVYVYICATQALECRHRCWYMYLYVPYKLLNAGAGVLYIFQGQMHKLVWYAYICSVWMPKLCLIEQLDNQLHNRTDSCTTSKPYIFQGRMHQLVWYAYIHRYIHMYVFDVPLISQWYLIWYAYVYIDIYTCMSLMFTLYLYGI